MMSTTYSGDFGMLQTFVERHREIFFQRVDFNMMKGDSQGELESLVSSGCYWKDFTLYWNTE